MPESVNLSDALKRLGAISLRWVDRPKASRLAPETHLQRDSSRSSGFRLRFTQLPIETGSCQLRRSPPPPAGIGIDNISRTPFIALLRGLI